MDAAWNAHADVLEYLIGSCGADKAKIIELANNSQFVGLLILQNSPETLKYLMRHCGVATSVSCE
jgi:hypothetical protein